MFIYQLTVEDMSTLGAMGSSPTTTEVKPFSTLAKAKAYAEKDYGKKITWESIQRTLGRVVILDT
jgi:nitrous oxide reductase accessory protein NosL